MSKVTLSRRHNLGHGKLVAEVEQLAEQLVEKYGGDYRWHGDRLTYRYSGGVTACVQCGEDTVDIDLTFGMLMSMLKAPVTRQIEDYLDKHLG